MKRLIILLTQIISMIYVILAAISMTPNILFLRHGITISILATFLGFYGILTLVRVNDMYGKKKNEDEESVDEFVDRTEKRIGELRKRLQDDKEFVTEELDLDGTKVWTNKKVENGALHDGIYEDSEQGRVFVLVSVATGNRESFASPQTAKKYGWVYHG